MHKLPKKVLLLAFIVAVGNIALSFAGTCKGDMSELKKGCINGICCAKMGGVSYCDSSAGRLVCNNGYYSSCYCTHHAVMDLQLLKGCCLWQGGVQNVNIRTGMVICRNGNVSEECTLHNRGMFGGIW